MLSSTSLGSSSSSSSASLPDNGHVGRPSLYSPQSILPSPTGPLPSPPSPIPATVSPEYVRALHSFVPVSSASSETCLSFEAGQIIRTLNKDRSGWWDGELEGRRGWFPSNYVESVEEGDLNTIANYQDGRGKAFARTPEDIPLTLDQVRSTRSATGEQYFMGIIEPIEYAITLLQNAVLADRIAEYQPSTALVISSVRTVLSSSNCLTRESTLLAQHPSLSSHRRSILSSLASLVNQARRASNPSLQSQKGTGLGGPSEKDQEDDLNEEARTEDAERMLSLAEGVKANVSQFLEECRRCGVQMMTDETALGGAGGGVAGESVAVPNISKPLPTSVGQALPRIVTNGFPSGSAFNPTNLSPHPLNSSAIDPPKSGTLSPMLKSLAPFSIGSDSSGNDLISKAQQQPRSAGQSSEGTPVASSIQSSSASSIRSVQSTAPNSPYIPSFRPLVIKSLPALSNLLSALHDSLLSTIAAFIGHVHQHSRSSHSSSFAYLIDMTRETIDRVREVLVIVEAVSINEDLALSPTAKVKDVEWLAKCRETLYIDTTSLVTAARIATAESSVNDRDKSTALGSAATVDDATDDEEKKNLLQAATSVLRSGGDCITAVKAVALNPDVLKFELVLQDLSADGSHISATTLNQFENSQKVAATRGDSLYDEHKPDGEEESGDEVEELDAGNQVNLGLGNGTKVKRGNHTLSMLGRKASSLNALKEKYDPENLSLRSSSPSISGIGTVTEESDDGDHPSYLSGSSSRRPSSASSSTDRTVSDPVGGYSKPSSIVLADSSSTHGAKLGTSSGSDSVSMSRGVSDSSRTSESIKSMSMSSRSEGGFSRTSTTGTSPRSSIGMQADLNSKGLRIVPPVAFPRLSGHTSPRRSMASSPSLAITPNSPSSTASRTQTESPLPSPPLPPGYQRKASSSSIGNNENERWFLQRDYEAKDISFNSQGQVTGGTLKCLIERMTLHDTTIDPTFSNTFFLTFRMFTTPIEVAELLYQRFDIKPPSSKPLTPEELKVWQANKLTPVRLRIYNFFKTWLETQWRHESDCVIVDGLLDFCKFKVAETMLNPSTRLVDLIQKRVIGANESRVPSESSTLSPTSEFSMKKGPTASLINRGLQRMQSTDRLKGGKVSANEGSMYSAMAKSPNSVATPAVIVNKNLIQALRMPSTSINIFDIDPLELARQLTILESKVYCSIQPEELLGQEFSKKSSMAVNVRKMSTLSTRLTGWISEIILNEQDAKKRANLIKYFIKLSERCLGLNNYNTLFAITCALTSSTISRLKKTWDSLAPKYRAALENLRKATEHSRNYAEYRAKIRTTIPPCLPFVGLYLTDITFCHEGNPPVRPSPVDSSFMLINFDRYQKISRIVADLQRFQVPYNLTEVPEIQTYLTRALEGLQHGGDVTSLYRQSLMVEPRIETAGSSSSSVHLPTSKGGDPFNWKG